MPVVDPAAGRHRGPGRRRARPRTRHHQGEKAFEAGLLARAHRGFLLHRRGQPARGPPRGPAARCRRLRRERGRARGALGAPSGAVRARRLRQPGGGRAAPAAARPLRPLRRREDPRRREEPRRDRAPARRLRARSRGLRRRLGRRRRPAARPHLDGARAPAGHGRRRGRRSRRRRGCASRSAPTALARGDHADFARRARSRRWRASRRSGSPSCAPSRRSPCAIACAATRSTMRGLRRTGRARPRRGDPAGGGARRERGGAADGLGDVARRGPRGRARRDRPRRSRRRLAARGARPGSATCWLALLRHLLPEGAPFRRAPAGIDDDRLLGGLDLVATLQAGRPVIGPRHPRRGRRRDRGRRHGGAAAGLGGRPPRRRDRRERGRWRLEREGLAATLETHIGVVALDEGREDDERPPEALPRPGLGFLLDLTEVSFRRDRRSGASDPAAVAAARARLAEVAISDARLEALCGGGPPRYGGPYVSLRAPAAGAYRHAASRSLAARGARGDARR